MDKGLPDGIRNRDPERWLSILWSPAAARPALIAIPAIDLEMARVVAEAREAMLAEIRLAWWREQLQALGRFESAPAQPILAALAHDAQPRAVDLAALAAIEDGHLPLLLAGPRDAASIAMARGAPLFVALATALSGAALDYGARAAAEAAGTCWAMAQLWRDHAMAPPGDWVAPHLSARCPRPLLALARLAATDLEDAAEGNRKPAPHATAGRQWRMARTMLGI